MRQTGGIAATAVGVLLTLTAGPPAWAQDCTTECSMYQEGECIEYWHHCTEDLPVFSFGAIAYGRTSRAWGYSYSWDSQAKAESVALQNCAQHGNDCEVMVWFDRKCGAVVAAEGASAFWGLGDSEAEARADAQTKCEQGGGKDCKVCAYQCSK